MKLLFISLGARIIYDNKGNQYLNSHMNRATINRYSKISTELRLILRDSGIRCSEKVAKEKYNPFPHDLASLLVCYNPYSPKLNFLNIAEKQKMKKTIEQSVDWADRVIIASGNGPYANAAVCACENTSTPYMILVGGFAFESDWYHGITGKFSAYFREKDTKKNLKNAPYALYVTQNALQERYPCKGKTLGCSDVQIEKSDECVLNQRLHHIKCRNEKSSIIIGTAAAIDVRWKGHKFVIKALSILKRKGYTNFEYQLLGNGDSNRLKKYAEEYGVSDQVYFLGSRPHNKVNEWLDSIDIYIQPSFTEGLCRSLVEAMARACPVIASTAGGNPELCSGEFTFKAGCTDEIADRLIKMANTDTMIDEAQKSFNKALEFDCEMLEQNRQQFLLKFMRG